MTSPPPKEPSEASEALLTFLIHWDSILVMLNLLPRGARDQYVDKGDGVVGGQEA